MLWTSDNRSLLQGTVLKAQAGRNRLVAAQLCGSHSNQALCACHRAEVSMRGLWKPGSMELSTSWLERKLVRAGALETFIQRLGFPACGVSTASSSFKMFSVDVLWPAILFSEERRTG